MASGGDDRRPSSRSRAACRGRVLRGHLEPGVVRVCADVHHGLGQRAPGCHRPDRDGRPGHARGPRAIRAPTLDSRRPRARRRRPHRGREPGRIRIRFRSVWRWPGLRECPGLVDVSDPGCAASDALQRLPGPDLRDAPRHGHPHPDRPSLAPGTGLLARHARGLGRARLHDPGDGNRDQPALFHGNGTHRRVPGGHIPVPPVVPGRAVRGPTPGRGGWPDTAGRGRNRRRKRDPQPLTQGCPGCRRAPPGRRQAIDSAHQRSGRHLAGRLSRPAPGPRPGQGPGPTAGPPPGRPRSRHAARRRERAGHPARARMHLPGRPPGRSRPRHRPRTG